MGKNKSTGKNNNSNNNNNTSKEGKSDNQPNSSNNKGSSSTSSKYNYKIPVAVATLSIIVSLALSYVSNSNNRTGSGNSASSSSHASWRHLQEEETLPVPQPRFSKEKDTDCKNRHPDADCNSMAKSGSCESSPGWMWVMCPKACNACKYRKPEYRCVAERIGMKPPLKPAFKPGEMDTFFETLPKHHPEYNIEFLHKKDPWIAIFHDFLTDAEVKALIAQTARGMRRSTDQGTFDEEGVQEQVVSSGRTSTNAWCDHVCENNKDVKSVTDKIEMITGIPRGHYESFQVLRYEIDQYYNVHHDSSEEDNKVLSGPRVLTFFIYLSDVEEGGGTHFPKLNITMMPKRGDAILWPSVLSDDLTKLDHTTYHAALPVKKGVKYAANHWIHLYNYKVPNLYGCTGSFD